MEYSECIVKNGWKIWQDAKTKYWSINAVVVWLLWSCAEGGVQNDYHKHFNDRGVLVMVRWGPVRWPTDALKRRYEGWREGVEEKRKVRRKEWDNNRKTGDGHVYHHDQLLGHPLSNPCHYYYYIRRGGCLMYDWKAKRRRICKKNLV